MNSAEDILWKILFGVLCFVGVLLLVMIFCVPDTPPRRYKLPTGKIVTCSYFQETNKGNYVLKECEDGIKYYTNGTIEELP